MPALLDRISKPLEFFRCISARAPQYMPFFKMGVSAGFPSPAADYIQNRLDVYDHLVQHPAATFFVRVKGNSMEDANLFNGDLLVVDKSLEASHKSIVVAVINGEFTVKRFLKTPQGIMLKAENASYSPIHINADMDFEIWGVVTHIIHQAK
jgi:DNA polymerase V